MEEIIFCIIFYKRNVSETNNFKVLSEGILHVFIYDREAVKMFWVKVFVYKMFTLPYGNQNRDLRSNEITK